jgi:hypothetical protein
MKGWVKRAEDALPIGPAMRVTIAGPAIRGGLPSFPDERLDDVIGDGLDLAFGQWRRMRIVRPVGPQVLALQSIAIRIVISVFVAGASRSNKRS